jgi:uncharacterized protein (TIGR03083 family)
MDLNAYLAVLAAEATVLASAADEAGLDADVPTCPGWTVADLVLHLGEVHRWATAAVASGATKLSDVPPDFLGPLPDAADSIDWFRNGATRLCDTLADADPSVDYPTFLSDPITPPLLFWARRQTLETSMHRVDAESATGRCTGLAPDVAIDGIDEFLTGFLPRSRTKLHADTERSLLVAPDYSDRRWIVTISNELPVTTRVEPGADVAVECTISGSASDIYLVLWNRASLDAVCVTGDHAVIDMLRDNVRIRWG